MGRTHQVIDDELRQFIESQHVFFVGTAPAAASGHVNVSPKGLDCLRVIDQSAICYRDYVGSGSETIAHLRENSRIVLMLCAFEGTPRILRLHGNGQVCEPHDREFVSLSTRYPVDRGVRAIIRVDVTRISESCGFAVPHYAFQGGRSHLQRWISHRTDEQIEHYQRSHNAESIDGLPSLRWVGQTEQT